jgi:hypothetical protein
MFLNLILEQKENKARGKKFENASATQAIFHRPGPAFIPRPMFAFRTTAAVHCRA